MLTITHTSGNARTAIFEVNGKKLTTPFFMTAATKAAIRHITAEEFKQLDGNAIICNSMLLSLRPGTEFIKNNGGVHKLMNFDGLIFTDSGGFQVIREFCKKIDNNCIWFKSPYDGQLNFLDPNKCIQNHINIASDVAMCLDHMPLAGATHSEALFSLNRTTEWAKLCKQEHDKLKQEHQKIKSEQETESNEQPNQQNKSNQLLFGICQGGIYPDLRERSIKEITSLDFDGYALGGLAIGEPKEAMFKMMKLGNSLLPKDKIRYILGLGNPLDIVEAVSMGYDCFDSVYPTQCARHNHLFTQNGILKIDQQQYKDDTLPIDKDCTCPACKNYTRAYIHYLTKIDEPIAYQLKSYHNIHFMYDLMKQIQTAIREDRFEQWKKEFVDRFVS